MKSFLKRMLCSAESITAFVLLAAAQLICACVVYMAGKSGLMYVDDSAYLQAALSVFLYSSTLLIVITESLRVSKDYYSGVVYLYLESAGSRSSMVLRSVLSSYIRWILISLFIYAEIALFYVFVFRSGYVIKIEDADVSVLSFAFRMIMAFVLCTLYEAEFISAGCFLSLIKPGLTAFSVLFSFLFYIFMVAAGGLGCVRAVMKFFTAGRYPEIAGYAVCSAAACAAFAVLVAAAAVLRVQIHDIIWKINTK